MANKIRITDHHFYLNEVDIGPFVASGSIVITEDRVTVALLGEVTVERSAPAKIATPKVAKEKHDNR